MGEWFVGEIRLFAGGAIPKNWMACDGQSLSPMEYQGLFSLIGTAFGGNGSTTFFLPDLRGRAIVGRSATDPSYARQGGVETVVLAADNLPAHFHDLLASTQQPNTTRPQNAYLATGSSTTGPLYAASDTPGDTVMSNTALSSVGGGAAHPNMQPYTTALYCIAVQGLYPTRD